MMAAPAAAEYDNRLGIGSKFVWEKTAGGGTGDNTLKLTADTLVGLSDTDTLTINGDAGDSINAGAGWTDTGTTVIGGEAYSIYTQVTTQGPATLVVNDAIDQSGVGG